MCQCIDFADAIVDKVGDEKIFGTVESNRERGPEFGACCRRPVPTKTSHSGTRDGSNSAGHIYLTDAIVTTVSDVKITEAVEFDINCIR